MLKVLDLSLQDTFLYTNRKNI